MANVILSGNSLVVNLTGTVSGTPVRGTISAVGNITGGNISSLGSINAVGDINAIGNITANINSISGYQLSARGPISAVGNITGGNVFSINNLSAGNTVFTYNMSATGTVTANNISANNFTYGNSINTGNITATGNVLGLNLVTTGNVRANGLISATGNIVSNGIGTGNILSTNISATGNVTTTGNVTAQYFIGNGSQLTNISGPAFGASVNSSFSYNYRVPNGGAFVPFNVVNFDTNGCYNAGTYRFTPTKPGYYQVNTSVGIGPFNGAWPVGQSFDLLPITVTIYKNGGSGGAWSAGSSSTVANAFAYEIAVPALIPMNGTTDYLSIYCSKGFTRTNFYSVTEGSYFQACWVRPL